MSFEIDQDTIQFYKKYVGIKDEQELVDHLTLIQQKLSQAGAINYRCIQSYKFACSRLHRRFFYHDLISLGKQIDKPYFLDIGCCTGTDLRQLLLDGYPKDYLMGVDIEKDYITIGYEQFKDDPDTCPIQFLTLDIFKLESTNVLCHSMSVIHTGSIFHLFETEEMVIRFFKKIRLLLKPGGIFVGGHVSSSESKQFYRESTNSNKYLMDSNKFRDLLVLNDFKDIRLESTPRDHDNHSLFWFAFYAIYCPK